MTEKEGLQDVSSHELDAFDIIKYQRKLISVLEDVYTEIDSLKRRIRSNSARISRLKANLEGEGEEEWEEEREREPFNPFEGLQPGDQIPQE